ncbi:putative Histidine kinase [Candidatus Zixiibacteriota bacterium]|nr:putative Histidine kinase [candidate division Zixibacteria bacterium]
MTGEILLQPNMEKYRYLYESAPVGLYRSAVADGKILECNKYMAQMFGFEDITQFIASFKFANYYINPDDRQAIISQLLQEGHVYGKPALLRRRDGTRILIKFSAALSSDQRYIDGVAFDATDQFQAEERFQVIFDSINEGILMLDTEDFKILEANQKACEMFGYSSKEFLRVDTTLLHSGEALYNEEEFKTRLKNSPDSRLQALAWRCRRKNGELFWVELNTKPATIGGKPQLIISGHDITIRKRIQESLIESEARMRAMTDSAQDAIIIMDDSGNISYWNPAAEKILRYKSDEAIGKPLHYLLGPKRHHEAFEKAFATFVQTGQGNAVGKTLELEAVRKDGNEIPIELSMSAMHIKGAWHAIGIMRDISGRKKGEEALRESEEKFRIITDSAKDGIIMIDDEGKICLWNKAAISIFGFSNEEAVDQNLFRLLKVDQDPNWQKFRIDIDRSSIPEVGALEIAELQAISKNGLAVPVEVSVSTIKLKGKWVAIAIVRDISELQRNRSQLVQSEKLAAIGTLAAGVAHEINNPIGYISSNLNTLAKYALKIKSSFSNYAPADKEEAEQVSEILDDCASAINESLEGAARVKKIVADLKSFSRIDRAEHEYANINEGIESTLNIVWNELKYKCKVERQFGQIPELYCIPNQLNQVLMNLLVNAGQAITGESGLIQIRTWADQGNIFISVKDNGCGIPKENLSKIFEAFFTTKAVGKGTGLGLSLTYDIIKKHKGRIDVESEPGKGTEFIITLPLENGLNEKAYSAAGR